MFFLFLAFLIVYFLLLFSIVVMVVLGDVNSGSGDGGDGVRDKISFQNFFTFLLIYLVFLLHKENICRLSVCHDVRG